MIMVIGENVAAVIQIVREGFGLGGIKGTTSALWLLSHLSLNIISLWLAELIMEWRGNVTLETHLRLSVKFRSVLLES